MKRTNWMQGLIKAEEQAKKDGEWIDDHNYNPVRSFGLGYYLYLNGGLSYFSNQLIRNTKPTIDNKALELTNGDS